MRPLASIAIAPPSPPTLEVMSSSATSTAFDLASSRLSLTSGIRGRPRSFCSGNFCAILHATRCLRRHSPSPVVETAPEVKIKIIEVSEAARLRGHEKQPPKLASGHLSYDIKPVDLLANPKPSRSQTRSNIINEQQAGI